VLTVTDWGVSIVQATANHGATFVGGFQHVLTFKHNEQISLKLLEQLSTSKTCVLLRQGTTDKTRFTVKVYTRDPSRIRNAMGFTSQALFTYPELGVTVAESAQQNYPDANIDANTLVYDQLEAMLTARQARTSLNHSKTTTFNIETSESSAAS